MSHPYGTWKSPITSEFIVADSVRLMDSRIDGEDVYWLEMRPRDAGRYVLVRQDAAGQKTDVTPEGFNVRTRVQEYGGGAFIVDQGTVYFSNFTDQRLYAQRPGEPPTALTEEASQQRYADATVDASRGRLICVREDHSIPGSEAVTTIVAVPLKGAASNGEILVSGSDFYMSPRVSPRGDQLAWIQWSHPNMPWDGTELCVAPVDAEGRVGERRVVAGGAEESVVQPQWSSDDSLHFISDRSGWWNHYRLRDEQIEPLCPRASEFAGPAWVFGLSDYAVTDEKRLLCIASGTQGKQLAWLDTTSHSLEPIELPFTSLSDLHVQGSQAVFIGGQPTKPSCVVQFDLQSKQYTVCREASQLAIDPGYLSVPRAIEFPTEDGLTAHAYYYPPTNKDCTAPVDERPPLLVKSHGGPTSAASSNFNLGIQYWTSRGFAVVDVNYGGSTGYGRAYRQRLNGRWGLVDVDDCVNAAIYLVEQSLADRQRLAIDGGSAGGYTTLAALTFRDVFHAGASHFGVSDLGALAEETHKFESRYLDNLIGPYPATKDIYDERSPLNSVERLSCPVIFFQGDEDRVVLPSQAERMVDALREKRIPVAYVLFEGEQHGFRKSENIRAALDGEFSFYAQIFGFQPADDLPAIPIENLHRQDAT